MATLEMQLFEAAKRFELETVSALLRDHPEIDVNFATSAEYTSLHAASCLGQWKLSNCFWHPKINVNVKTSIGQTPHSIGCQYGYLSVVRLLLKDPRVDILLDDEDGHTPLWWASCWDHHGVIEWLIASGRDLGDFENKKGRLHRP